MKFNWKSVDVFLLFFLTFFTIDKAILKPTMILAGIVYLWKYAFVKDAKWVGSFYLAMVVLAIVNFLFINIDFNIPHFISASVGIVYWGMAFFALAIVKNRVQTNETKVTANTLDVYFIINILWSIGNLVMTMYKSGSVNPYGLTDEAFGNSSGDYIKGLLMGPSYINMFVNSFFCIYYLYKRQFLFACMATFVICLTTSNFAIAIFALAIVAILFVLRDTRQRLFAILQLGICLFFNYVVANSNFQYAVDSVSTNKYQSDLNSESRKTVPTEVYQKTQASLKVIYKYKYGKIYSFLQTRDFLMSGPKNCVFGAGIGNFSSHLAVRTSDLPIKQKSRLFEMLPRYMSEQFKSNHYKIFRAVYLLPPGYHSIRHFPSSSANQLLGEYGILGALGFMALYLFYFLKRYRFMTYSLLMLFLLSYFLLFDYLFEYLSVVVFFELFYFLNIKEEEAKREADSVQL